MPPPPCLSAQTVREKNLKDNLKRLTVSHLPFLCWVAESFLRLRSKWTVVRLRERSRVPRTVSHHSFTSPSSVSTSLLCCPSLPSVSANLSITCKADCFVSSRGLRGTAKEPKWTDVTASPASTSTFHLLSFQFLFINLLSPPPPPFFFHSTLSLPSSLPPDYFRPVWLCIIKCTLRVCQRIDCSSFAFICTFNTLDCLHIALLSKGQTLFYFL